MKNLCISLLIIMLFSSGISAQENQEVKNNEFRLELLNFIGSTFYAEYERRLSDDHGLNIVIAPTAIDNNNKTMYGMLVQVNPKLYFTIGKNNKSQQRIYFSPYANYRYLDISQTSTYYPYNYYNGTILPQTQTNTFIASSAGIGMLIGFKIEAGNFFIFNLEAGGGPRYVFNKSGNTSYNNVNEGFNNWNLGYSGIFPRFNMTMGFKF